MPFCNQCGQKFKLGEETCAKCGLELPQLPDTTIIVPGKKDLAIPKLKRLVAGFIDILIVLIIFFALISYKRRFIVLLLRRGLAMLLPHLYLLLKDSIEGKSIGKLLVGVIVYNEKEKKAGGFLDSIIRNWYLAIPVLGPTLFAFIIGIQILRGKHRLGDRQANTIVITDSDFQRIK